MTLGIWYVIYPLQVSEFAAECQVRFNKIVIFSVTIGSATLARHAYSAPLTAQDILQQFNAVVSNDFTSQHDVEGRLVAGTLTGGATFYNNPSAVSAPSSFAAINVTNGVNANVDNGGSVKVQGRMPGIST